VLLGFVFGFSGVVVSVLGVGTTCFVWLGCAFFRRKVLKMWRFVWALNWREICSKCVCVVVFSVGVALGWYRELWVCSCWEKMVGFQLGIFVCVPFFEGRYCVKSRKKVSSLWLRRARETRSEETCVEVFA